MTMLANGGRPAARLITGAHQRTAGLYLALREAAASDTDLARRLREVEERRLVSAEQGLSSTGYSTSHPKRRRKGEGHEGHQAGRDRPDVPHGGDRRCAGGGGVAGRRRRYPDRCVEPHECRQVVWLRGATQVAPGVRFRGRDRSGWLRWSRVCEVIAVQAPRELVWRTIATPLLPDSTEWRIALESVGGGTRIVQSYQVTRCPGWFPWVVVRVNPAHIDRGGALGEDLRRSGVIAAGDARVVESAG